ncbi:MAG: hypothetical protein IKV74_06020 [Clostridia bacterium]|nr:hypothetical protein [Clostridia bacterium]
MRKIACVFTLILLVLSMVACSPETASDKQAQQDVQNALGDYQQLPMDMEQVKNKLTGDVVIQNPKDEQDCTEVVVGDNVVICYSVIEETATSTDGNEYQFKITLMYFGSARAGKDHLFDLHFIGANIVMELSGDNLDAVRQDLLSQIDQMDLSKEDAMLLKDLMNGKQVYADTQSHLWEMYAEVAVDVKAIYDPESGTFKIQKEDTYDEIYDQYSYAILDFKGREHKCVYYKLDGDGKKWITEEYEYTYLPDGSIEKHSVDYWEYTKQIRSESITVDYMTENERWLWYRTYQENGTLEEEQYYNEDNNYVLVHYDASGDITEKRIHKNHPDGNIIYEEEYYGGGKLWRKSWNDGSIAVAEEYYENGCLSASRTFDLSLMDPDNGVEGIIQTKKGYEDGRVNITEYYKNGNRKRVTYYSATGEVLEITCFDETGKVIQ